MADILGGGSSTEESLTLNAGDSDSISLPEGFPLTEATFEVSGDDLVITAPDGTQVVVEDYYGGDAPPELTTPDGVQISADVVGELAGGVEQAAVEPPAEPGEGDAELAAGTDSAGSGGGGGGLIADNPEVITGTDGEPIGNVENISGTVWAIRTDGTKVELEVGDPVYQGDILESAADGAVGVLLADETTSSMAENGRMVLDEMIYDPATEDGSVSLSVLQGVFTFVSGQVAKTDPDAMTLDTPVATIGIRGTQVGIEIPDGENLNVVLMEEADGFVGEVVVLNDAGSQVLNNANQFTLVQSFDLAPTEIELVEETDMVENFAQALQHLPLIHGNQNDFGLQESGEEEFLDEEIQEIEEFLDTGTAAGEEGPEEQAPEEAEEITVTAETDFEVEVEFEAPEVVEVEPEPEEVEPEPEPEPEPIIPTDDDGRILVDVDVEFDGSDEAEFITGGGGADTIDAGDDFVDGGEGADQIDGGAGTDTLVVAGAAADADLIINLESARVTSGDNSISVQYLAGFENIVSGNDDDVIIGSDVDNVITGGLGDDTIVGGEGQDTAKFSSTFSIDGSNETTVTFDPDAGTITVVGPDGTDTLSEIETLEFDGLDVAVIDGPTLEDTAFNLETAGAFDELMAEGAVSITISGVPNGAVLLDSTGQPLDVELEGDTWVLTAETETTVDPETGEETVTVVTPLEDVLADLSIMPPADSSDDFTLWVGGQNANGGPIGDASMVNMVVTGVADTANLEVGDVVGPEDTWIPLDVSAALTDPDGSETLSISIEGIPKGEGFNSPDTFSQFQFKTSNDPNAEWIVVSLDEDSPNTFNLMGQSDENPDGYTAAEMTVILETLQIKAPFNHDEDFDLTFTATVTEDDGDSLVEKMVSTVNVMPRADEPNLQLEGTEILADNQIVQLTDNLEDTPISLNILPESTDPSEVLSLTIGDIPLGAVIKVGRLFGEGEEQQLIEIELPVIDNTVSIPMEFRDSITITPPPNSNEDFQLTVTATSTEPEAEFQLTAIDNNEGDGINAFDGMAGATEVTISGFPEGSTLSAGTDNGDGTWTISANHADALADILANVTLTVPEGTDEDFALQVTGVDATDGALGPNTIEVAVEDVSVANPTGILDIQVTGDADEVDIQINDVTGDEDTAIPLDITANLTDTDGSETLTVKIEGVPEGAVLTAGGQTLTPMPDGSYVLSSDDLADVAITPPLHSDVDFNLGVTVTNTENDGDSRTSDTFEMAVTVNAVADEPLLGVTGLGEDGDLDGTEDTNVPLSITPAELVDTDGSETLSITISGVPDGASLTAGTDNGDGSWTFVDIYETSIDPETGEEVTTLVSSIADQLNGLELSPPADSNENFDLTVTATATEGANQDQASNVQTIHVDMHGVADTPTLTAALGDPVENGDGEVLEPDGSITYDIDIASALTDTDAAQGRAESETLSITLDGVPDGVVFSAGVKNDDGTWTLGPDDLAGLQMTLAV